MRMRQCWCLLALCSLGCGGADGALRLPQAPMNPGAVAIARNERASQALTEQIAFRERLKEQTAGYKLTSVLKGRLEQLTTVKYAVVRGQCYVAALELGQGAAFHGAARDVLSVQSTIPGEGTRTQTDGAGERGVIANLGCPLETGNLSFDVLPSHPPGVMGPASADSNHHPATSLLGHGSYELRFYSRTIDEFALEAQRSQRDKEAQQQADEQQLKRLSAATLPQD